VTAPFTITLDTGALIALERAERRMRIAAAATNECGGLLVVPAPVVIEWWRGDRQGSRRRQGRIFESIWVEPTTATLAKLAGEALAATPGATPIDALVMASAAQRGDVVYTSDFEDLDRLRSYFPNVRVLRA
jgi:predicted nucleic acid-binding protein